MDLRGVTGRQYLKVVGVRTYTIEGVCSRVTNILLYRQHDRTTIEVEDGHWHGTVKPLYSERSWDRIKCSLYRGVHPRGSPRFSYSRFLFRMLFTAQTETSN